MKEIEYLPKFYDRKDIIAKQREVEACIKELLASQKLTRKEIEEISDFDITECAHAYDRNYVIERVNELQEFVECR